MEHKIPVTLDTTCVKVGALFAKLFALWQLASKASKWLAKSCRKPKKAIVSWSEHLNLVLSRTGQLVVTCSLRLVSPPITNDARSIEKTKKACLLVPCRVIQARLEKPFEIWRVVMSWKMMMPQCVCQTAAALSPSFGFATFQQVRVCVASFIIIPLVGSDRLTGQYQWIGLLSEAIITLNQGTTRFAISAWCLSLRS